MLTCIARQKKLGDDSLSQPEESDSTNMPNNKQQAAIKSLTSQVLILASKSLVFFFLFLFFNLI